MKNYLWIFVLAGIWLIIAPFIFDYIQTNAALWNDILMGLLIIVVSIFAYSQSSE